MLIKAYILFVCYVPMLFSLLPKVGEDINVVWLVFFMLPLGILSHAVIKQRLKFLNLWIFILAYFSLVVCASILWSSFRSYDLYTVKRLFGHLFVPIIVSIGAFNLFSEKANIHSFARHISYSALILSAINIYQFISRSGHQAQIEIARYAKEHSQYEISRFAVEYSRVSATFDNSNALAIFLCLTFPIILYCWNKRLFSGMMSNILMIAVAAGIATTGSRKGIVSLALSVALYCFMARKFKQLLFIGIIAVTLGGFVAGRSQVLQRFDEQKVQEEIGARWGAASLGLKMFAESPLIGLGYQGYFDNTLGYRGTKIGRRGDAHNVYVTILANFGLLGFLPYIAVLFYPLIVSIRRFLRASGKGEVNHSREMATISISALIPFIISAWFAGGLLDNWQALNLLYTIIMFPLAVNAVEKPDQQGDQHSTLGKSSQQGIPGKARKTGVSYP